MGFRQSLRRIAALALTALVCGRALGAELHLGWYSYMSHPEYLDWDIYEGCDVVVPYGGQSIGKSTVRAYLDSAQSKGFKVLFDLHTLPGQPNWPLADELVDRVKTFKDHPAVWAWYTADEPSEGNGNTKAFVEDVYQKVKAEDPDRSVMVVFIRGQFTKKAGTAGEFEADDYANAHDVTMVDHYPGCTYGAMYPEWHWMVRRSYQYWGDAQDYVERYDKDGLILVPMGFGVNEDGTPLYGNWRDMTYEEHRYHVFSGLMYGPMALLFWADNKANSAIRTNVKKIIAQIVAVRKQMENGTTNDPAIGVNQSPDSLVFRHGVEGSSHAIAAVNIAKHAADNTYNGGEQFDAEFDISSVAANATQVDVVGEGRTISVSGGVFGDHFQKFDVHVYSFAGDPTSAGARGIRAPSCDVHRPSGQTHVEVFTIRGQRVTVGTKSGNARRNGCAPGMYVLIHRESGRAATYSERIVHSGEYMEGPGNLDPPR